MAGAEGSGWRDDAARSARHLVRGMWAGIVCGLVIGGIGGRLAMFVLRLTSDPAFQGRLTDDEFEIGSFTGATLFLVVLCVAAGMLGGLFYIAVRGWLPGNVRPWAMGVFGGAFGGAVVIKPGGIDFTELDPLALAVVMFIALPALYGFVMSWLAEKMLARTKEGGKTGTAVAFLPLLGIGLAGPFGLALIVGLIGGWALNRSGVPIATAWHSRPVTWIGRAAFAGATAFALFTLSQDVIAVL